MMPVNSGGVTTRTVFITIAALLFFFSAGVQRSVAAEIPWKTDEIFNRISVDENLQDVLRAVFRQNGQHLIFRPGVEGVVTFEFENMPLQGAFNKIATEFELHSLFDATSNTVTISVLGKEVLETFRPNFITLAAVRSALTRYYRKNLLKKVNIEYDEGNRFLLLRGAPEDIANTLKIIQQLDQGEQAALESERIRQETEMKRRDLEQKERELNLANDLRDIQLEAAQNRQEEVQKALDVHVKIIQLRYVSVGSSEVTFEGKTTTVPGISETLQNLFVSTTGNSSNAQTDEKASAPGTTMGFSFPAPSISMDERTNSVIVRGSTEAIQWVEEILAELDKPEKMVEMEVMIVVASAGATKSLGVTLGGGGYDGTTINADPETDTVALGVNSGLSAATDTITRGTTSPTSLLPAAMATRGLTTSFIFQGTRNFLEAAIKTFIEDTKSHIVASPRIITLNNMDAKITSNSTRRAVEQDGDGTGMTLTSVSAGLNLGITPSIIQDPEAGARTMVRLKVNASRSGFASTTGTDTTNSELATNVIIPDNATFIMGGLFSTTLSDTETGIPLLKDIPLIGALFRDRSAADSRAETIFLITPRVLAENDLLSQDIGIRHHVMRQKDRLDQERLQMLTSNRLIDLSINLEEDE